MTEPFPLRLETFACQDDLHTWCDGTGIDDEGDSVTCGCECHTHAHSDDLDCWCGPYRDAKEPSVIVHREGVVSAVAHARVLEKSRNTKR